MAEYNEWSSRHYLRCGKYSHLKSLCPSSLADQSSHGGGENSTSLTINESMPVKTGEFSVTMAKPLIWSFILTGYGCVIRFKNGVFIENLKDKGLGKVWLKEFRATVECLGSQQAVGLSRNALGHSRQWAFHKTALAAPISFTNDKTTSFYVNPTFEGPHELRVDLISNVLDLKRHTVVTFKENLEHNSKSKMGKGIVIARENSSSISRGHGVENKKGNGHSGKTLNKTIHGCGERDVRVRSLFKFFRNIIENIDWFNLIIAKLGFQNSHCAKVVRFSSGIWIGQSVLVSFVYGSSNSQKMRHLWDALQGTIPLNGFPWVGIGDFSAILSSSEKK
ncbi:hypothetical protein Goari_023616 [Gossypium aridum]|uniref:Uncharacterized protein n=1 Tax=Gossypium aridum TaxID=34290 RepID=A0A7J8X3M8_GOSAI|nr:hypothetical protein [Gossypium aridum]